MNNITIINTFNSANSNVTNIKTQHCSIMGTITKGILKFEPMIKIPIVANYAFFTVNTLMEHQFLHLNQFYHNTALRGLTYQNKN